MESAAARADWSDGAKHSLETEDNAVALNVNPTYFAPPEEIIIEPNYAIKEGIGFEGKCIAYQHMPIQFSIDRFYLQF